VPYQHINKLVNQKRGITPITALRLARFFDMSPGFWLSLQARWGLYRAEQVEKTELANIQNYHQLQESA
jgi:addiction module HigA family antidote